MKHTIGQEIIKQLVDQALHFAWGAVAGALLRHHPTAWVGLLAVGIFIVREYHQWPSSRPWDPYLDWVVFAVAVVMGFILAL